MAAPAAPLVGASGRVSEPERKYIVDGIRQDVRVDGRGRLDHRFLTVEVGLLPLANGSSRVTLVTGETEVIVAVKAELVTPEPGAPDRGVVECDVDSWGPAAAAASDGARAAAGLNTEMAAALNRILGAPGAVDTRALCVIPGKYAWRVHVDCLVLSCGGGLLDALALAAYAALGDARIPRLRLVPTGEAPGEVDVELMDDEPGAEFPFPAGGVPVALTFTQVGGHSVVDATDAEEACADSAVTLAINRDGHVVSLLATGGAGGLPPQTLHAALEAGRTLAPALFARADAALARLRERGRKGDLASASVDAAGGLDSLSSLLAGGGGLGAASLEDVGTTLISRLNLAATGGGSSSGGGAGTGAARSKDR